MLSGAERTAQGISRVCCSQGHAEAQGDPLAAKPKGVLAISQLRRQRQKRVRAHLRNGDHARPHGV